MNKQTDRTGVTGRRSSGLAGAVGLLLALALLAGGALPVYADTPPPLPLRPHGFAGSVSVLDQPGLAPAGILVEAFVDGEKTQETTVDAASKYVVLVPGTPGATVTFRVGGVPANESAQWEEAKLQEPFDLTVDELTLAQYNLTISSTAGGSVTTPGEVTFIYYDGLVLGLAARAEEGYRFAGWSGDVDAIGNVDAAETTITMGGDYSITANFREIPPPINWLLIGGVIAIVVAAGLVAISLVRRKKAAQAKEH